MTITCHFKLVVIYSLNKQKTLGDDYIARNRVKLGSLTKQIQDVFDSKLAIGESKYQAKIEGKKTFNDITALTQNKIYSWGTYKSYIKQANYFAKYCKEKHGCRTLDECKPYINEWLQKQIEEGKSAYTQKLRACSLAKLYNCKSTDFIKTEVRNRENISRSRGVKVRDKHFAEHKHKDLVEFCRATGLRRKELRVLTGDKLVYKKEEDKYYIKVDAGAKGGRERLAIIIGNVESVVERMKSVGTNKVFDKIPLAADIHSYRADYATAIYKAHARPIEELKCNLGIKGGNTGDVYVCRGDLKGVVYDRKAMKVASKALGHNRISVIAAHYIRK